MNRRLTATALTIAFALTGAFGLTACSGSDSGADAAGGSTQSTSEPSGDDANALPPIMVAPEELDGRTIELTATDHLTITVDGPADGWTATADDPDVASAYDGVQEDTAEFNPGFEPVAAGTTAATVTAPDGTEHHFTIVVK